MRYSGCATCVLCKGKLWGCVMHQWATQLTICTEFQSLVLLSQLYALTMLFVAVLFIIGRVAGPALNTHGGPLYGLPSNIHTI